MSKMQQFLLEDNEPIDLFVSGKGQPIVLVHGWTSGPHIWQPVLEGLLSSGLKNFKVVAWQARGHGNKPLKTKTKVTFEQLCKDLKYLLEKLQLENPILVGHSMGAMLCWEYLKKYGEENIKGLVVIDQSPRLLNADNWPFAIYGNFTEEQNKKHIENLKKDFAEGALQLAANGLNSEIRKAYSDNADWIKDLRTYLNQLNHAAMISLWEGFSVGDWRSVIDKMKIPFRIIHGEKSQFYPAAVTDYLLTHTQDAKCKIIKGAHHSPQLTHPKEFQSILMDMISSI